MSIAEVVGRDVLDGFRAYGVVRCGTDAGYKKHRRLGEDPCGPCRAAHRQYGQDLERRGPVGRRGPTCPVGVSVGDIEWMADATCQTEKGFTEWPDPEAVTLCQQCPVKWDCLTYALTAEAYEPARNIRDFPVYGGMTGRQRAELRRRRSA